MSLESSLIVDGLDIRALSDEELYEKLIENGAIAGPITENTRKIYQRKLAVVLGGEVGNFSRIADTSQLDGNFSQEEEDAQPTQAYIDYLAAGESRLRRRQEQRVYDDAPADSSEDEYDGEAPASPSAAYVSYSSNASMSSAREAACEEQSEEEAKEGEAGGGYGSLLSMAAVLLVAVAVFFFLSSGEEDTFKKLENMAKAEQQRRGAHT